MRARLLTHLERYAAVAFVLTTGDVLNDDQQAAFERYIRAGHGFVGVHSAADTEYDWPWYGRLLGAYFKNHPAIQQATVTVLDPRHPSTARLPRRWIREDEWYNFASNPRRAVRVLATVDETTYAAGDGAMGRDHPIAWAHEFDGGRAWYTAAGHTEASYQEPLFLSHLLGGIQYAAGLAPPSILSIATRLRVHRVIVAIRDRGLQALRRAARGAPAGPAAAGSDATERRPRARDNAGASTRTVDSRRDAEEPHHRPSVCRPKIGQDSLNTAGWAVGREVALRGHFSAAIECDPISLLGIASGGKIAREGPQPPPTPPKNSGSVSRRRRARPRASSR